MRNVERGLRKTVCISFGGLVLIALMMMHTAADAEVKIIEADHAYTMSDNDSKVDARRVAVQEAKRKALEQAGTYLESLREVNNYQLTREEIKAYIAGIIETEIIADEAGYIKTRSRLDTDVLSAAIERYRHNENLKEQVKASSRENERLKKERDKLVKQITSEKNKAKADTARKKLNTVLMKEETNEETDKIWTTLVHFCGDDDEHVPEFAQSELDRSTATLERVVKVNPGNQRALYLLATLYQQNGNYEAAENKARAAIQKNPSNPVPHMKLGTLLHSQGRHKEALKEFHFVERLRPHNPMMLYYMGMTLKDMQRCSPSVQYLQRFLKNPAAQGYPVKKQKALQGIEDCGGARGGYQRRISTH